MPPEHQPKLCEATLIRAMDNVWACGITTKEGMLHVRSLVWSTLRSRRRVSACRSDCTVCMQLTKADYELPTLTAKVLAVGKEVSLGRGFSIVKCAPVLECAARTCASRAMP